MIRMIDLVTREVPCDQCTVCCQSWDLVRLDPNLGDDVMSYDVEMHWPTGRFMLKHRENGDCWYLDPNVGCMIHHRRPAKCRTMDCRNVLKVPKKKLLKLLSKAKIEALTKAAEALEARDVNKPRRG